MMFMTGGDPNTVVVPVILFLAHDKNDLFFQINGMASEHRFHNGRQSLKPVEDEIERDLTQFFHEILFARISAVNSLTGVTQVTAPAVTVPSTGSGTGG